MSQNWCSQTPGRRYSATTFDTMAVGTAVGTSARGSVIHPAVSTDLRSACVFDHVAMAAGDLTFRQRVCLPDGDVPAMVAEVRADHSDHVIVMVRHSAGALAGIRCPVETLFAVPMTSTFEQAQRIAADLTDAQVRAVLSTDRDGWLITFCRSLEKLGVAESPDGDDLPMQLTGLGAAVVSVLHHNGVLA